MQPPISEVKEKSSTNSLQVPNDDSDTDDELSYENITFGVQRAQPPRRYIHTYIHALYARAIKTCSWSWFVHSWSQPPQAEPICDFFPNMKKIVEVSSRIAPQLTHRGICLIDVVSWQNNSSYSCMPVSCLAEESRLTFLQFTICEGASCELRLAGLHIWRTAASNVYIAALDLVKRYLYGECAWP